MPPVPNNPRAKTLSDVIDELRKNRTDNTAKLAAVDASIIALSDAIKGLTDQNNKQRLKNLEKDREADRQSNAANSAPAAGAVAKGKGGRGNFLKGFLGGGLGGLLAGGALGGAVLGLTALAGLQLMDAQKIKDNVNTLFSIGERWSEDTLKNLALDGAAIVALKTLGSALITFGAGAAINAGVGYFVKDDWAGKVSANVDTLLSIGDRYKGKKVSETVGTVASDIGVVAALSALGLALIPFSAGKGFAAGVEKFTDPEWGKQIKENVTELLSIGQIENTFKQNAGAIAALALLGPALISFGAGAGTFGAADALGDWATGSKGEEGGNWAQEVKNNVQTLLSINDLGDGEWGTLQESGKFFGAMTGLGLGLGVFAVGSAAFSAADGLGDWITGTKDEAGGNWSQEVYDNVKKLLEIGELSNLANLGDFAGTMGVLSTGLLVFAASDFATGIGGAITNLLSFFTGGEVTAFGKLMELADNADRLTIGADALDRLAVSIGKIGKLDFRGDNIYMKEFAEDLAYAVPALETAVKGGSFDASWLPFNQVKLEGLSNPSMEAKYTEAARNIAKLRKALMVDPYRDAEIEASKTLATNLGIQNSRLGDLSEVISNLNLTINNINQDNSQTDNSDSSALITGGPASNFDEFGRRLYVPG